MPFGQVTLANASTIKKTYYNASQLNMVSSTYKQRTDTSSQATQTLNVTTSNQTNISIASKSQFTSTAPTPDSTTTNTTQNTHTQTNTTTNTAQQTNTTTQTAQTTVVSGDPKQIALQLLTAMGQAGQYSCLVTLWNRESGWRVTAQSASGAYGIPQALPGSKMSSFGSDWATNPETQIKWGLSYISGRYGTPCSALAHSNSTGWY